MASHQEVSLLALTRTDAGSRIPGWGRRELRVSGLTFPLSALPLGSWASPFYEKDILMNSLRARLPILLLELVVLGAAALLAQSSPTINLTVDATHAPEKILHTRMVMPVKPGPFTVLYPKWIPGEHNAAGPVGGVAGLQVLRQRQSPSLEADPLVGFTFHVDVPSGVEQLDVEFDYLEPSNGSATDKLVVVSWNQNVLYPAGIPADKITFHPTLRLPSGWKFGTPLPVESAAGEEVAFKPVSLEHLVDAPVIAGQYHAAGSQRRVYRPLAHRDGTKHLLHDGPDHDRGHRH